jgi:hypothetical protein
MLRVLRDLARGTDYFADLGRAAQVAAAAFLAPYALYFALVGIFAPVAAVGIVLVEGDWGLAGLMLGVGLVQGLFAIPLCWLVARLFRGRKVPGEVTVLPMWLVRAFLLAYLGPLSIGIAVAMVILAFRTAVGGDRRLALLQAAMACGFVAGLIRALGTAFRLGRRRDAEGMPGPPPGPTAAAEIVSRSSDSPASPDAFDPGPTVG